MRGTVKHVLDIIVVFRVHPGNTLAPALLLAIDVGGRALDITGVRHRDHAVFVRHQIFHVNVTHVGYNFRAPGVGIETAHLDQIRLHHAIELGVIGQQLLQIDNTLLQGPVFALDFATLQPGQLVETHIQNGIGLQLAKSKASDQLCPRLVAVARGPNDPDDLVEIIQCD